MMPVKTSEISTGIYRETSTRLEWDGGKMPKSKRDFENLRRFWRDRAPGFHGQLDALERVAKKIIKEAGGFPGRRRFAPKRRGVPAGGEWFPLPADAPPIARRARELIFAVWSLRDTLKKLEGDRSEFAAQVRDLALQAYLVGRRAEIVRVSPFEPAVVDGEKLQTSLQIARETYSGYRAEFKNSCLKVAREVASRHPNWSKSDVARETARRVKEEMGLEQEVSRETVRGYLKRSRLDS